MIRKILFTVACFQATAFLFAQTEQQKQIIYEHISRDSRVKGIVEKIDPIENKEVLFNKAQVLPVYKVEIKLNQKPKLIQNKNYFLILYLGRLYVFLDNRTTRLIETNPIIKNILELNKEKREYSIVYLKDTYSFDQRYLMPILTDKDVSSITDQGINYKLSEYIDFKYGSMDKYLENYLLENSRDKLSLNDFNTAITFNYEAFQANCSKDTTLVLKTLISQIGFATKNLTKTQESKLFEKIKYKINPGLLIQEQLKSKLIAAKVKDSDIQAALAQSKIENNKSSKISTKPEGLYSFSVYNVSVTDELLNILTNEQFVNYKNYIDLWYPIIETQNTYNNNKYRYNYGKDILEKGGLIKERDHAGYADYVSKKIQACGCKDSKI